MLLLLTNCDIVTDFEIENVNHYNIIRNISNYSGLTIFHW
jgi:hypothetical protein